MRPRKTQLFRANCHCRFSLIILASAAVHDGEDSYSALDVFSSSQFHHQGLAILNGQQGNQRYPGSRSRESSGADPPLHHALVAVDEFKLSETEQVLRAGCILGVILDGHLPVLTDEAGQPQFLEVVFQHPRGSLALAALSNRRVL